MKTFKNVGVNYESEYFHIVISDEELKLAKEDGIDIDNNDELIKYYLETHFEEYKHLLHIEDYEYKSEDKNENIKKKSKERTCF